MTPGELAERLAYQMGGLAGAIFFCFVVSLIAGRRDTGLRKFLPVWSTLSPLVFCCVSSLSPSVLAICVVASSADGDILAARQMHPFPGCTSHKHVLPRNTRSIPIASAQQN